MKLPWRDKTGISKAVAILVTLLLVSLGLCGANFVAVIGLVPMSGGGSSRPFQQFLGTALTFAGIAEIIGILGSILGLLVVTIIAIFNSLRSGDPPATIKGDD